jgi:hypothetical protein
MVRNDTDIHDKKHAEEKLRQDEMEFRPHHGCQTSGHHRAGTVGECQDEKTLEHIVGVSRLNACFMYGGEIGSFSSGALSAFIVTVNNGIRVSQ